ncbi:hypothetical protein G3480_19615 [Thiorhodococcus mannitoliphagus]|uniref:Uncharacterized protein n=1 Tax=Thiorhodococcus mannitoliphagus TaxID=329406 RepID=A0A6P1DWE4_9GAMM|nr:hypothetical protein [Thiorhodococcus mannitoliphagus]NEX22488.1 hypothetical protein [Thiorhodococcus mannitoliphagus]
MISNSRLPALAAIPVLFIGIALLSPVDAGDIKPLKTVVIKATTGLCKRGETCHKDRAGSWTPKIPIAVLGVSVAEQADIDLYTDVEVSTRPEMYQCAGDDSAGCIFRAKYAGPGLFDYGAASGSTYIGSNITTTSMTFPSGYGIMVPAGEPIYVHLDVRNGSLIDLKVDQDAWIYYVPVD